MVGIRKSQSLLALLIMPLAVACSLQPRTKRATSSVTAERNPIIPVATYARPKDSTRFGLLVDAETFGVIDPDDPSLKIQSLYDPFAEQEDSWFFPASRGKAVAYIWETPATTKSGKSQYGVWLANNHMEERRLIAKFGGDWVPATMAWSPDQRSLALLLYKTHFLDSRRWRYQRTYIVVSLEFTKQKARVVYKLSLEDENRDYAPPLPKDNFTLMTWTRTGIVGGVGTRIFKIDDKDRKTKLSINAQPQVGSIRSIDAGGRFLFYGAKRKLWCLALKAKSRPRAIKADQGRIRYSKGLLVWRADNKALLFADNIGGPMDPVFEIRKGRDFEQVGQVYNVNGYGAADPIATDPTNQTVFLRKPYGLNKSESGTSGATVLSLTTLKEKIVYRGDALFSGWIALD